jgi:hypothetical protein
MKKIPFPSIQAQNIIITLRDGCCIASRLTGLAI